MDESEMGSQEATKENDLDDVDQRPAKRKYKPRKPKAPCWNFFTKFIDEDGIKKARCFYCNEALCCDSSSVGTSGLNRHLLCCKLNKDNLVQQKQASISVEKDEAGKPIFKAWKFDPAKVKQSLINLFVDCELSFSLVERPGFINFVQTLCPNVILPSRFTLARDIANNYLEEKKRLKSFFAKSKPRVSFTTDTWTSVQRINYMVLTAHFIDDEWNYQKKIINFRPIFSHKGEAIASSILNCLTEWGIQNVMAFTLDNASSNDVAIRELCKSIPGLLSKGKYLHVRCLAHIINLIVQDGLKAEDGTIDCIRNAVKFIRYSANRLKLFTACKKEKGFETNAGLSLDVSTRWSSTCEMLERAVMFEEVFPLYALNDQTFRKSLDVVPDEQHWEYSKKVIKILELFKEKTTEVSCSTYAVAHEYYAQVQDISYNLDEMSKDCELLFDLKNTMKMTRTKFAKYFEDDGKINKIFQFALILDPRFKLELIDFACEKEADLIRASKNNMTDQQYKEMLEKMIGDVKSEMQSLVTEYEVLYQTSARPAVRKENNIAPTRPGKNSFMHRFESHRRLVGVEAFGKRSELEKYLKDEVEEKTEDFEILKWWKNNATRYPTLARMAKDILAIPISSVASEAAFSTGGRVIDSCRSSLSPQIVEALICTQDWNRKGTKEMEEVVEELEKFDDLANDVFEKIKSMG